MKTHFHITDEDFADYVKLTAQGETHYFQKDLTLELEDRDALNADIEWIKTEEYVKESGKPIFLRLLLTIAKWIIGPLVFFIDSYCGIRLDSGYPTFNPYRVKQSVSISDPKEKTVHITLTDPKYNKHTKKYSPPALSYSQADVAVLKEDIAFSEAELKRDWNVYHVSAFTVIIAIILLLNAINCAVAVGGHQREPLLPVSENIGRILGIALCSAVMLAILIAFIVTIVKACKLKKEVARINQ